MFETQYYSKALNEEVFEMWLEQGRNSRMPYEYIIIMWQVMEEEFKPHYVEDRAQLAEVASDLGIYETIVAVYDLYSESRISID